MSAASDMTRRFIQALRSSSSKSLLLAIAAGALSATAFPPLNLWPIGLICFSIFSQLIWRAGTVTIAAVIGWFFGFGHMTISNNWIATAFTYQSDMPQILGWLAVPLLCTYLAIFPAIASGVAFLIARKGGNLVFVTGLAGCWIITEWSRSWIFSGYPWPPLSMMFVGDYTNPGLAFLLPWLGTYALSGLVILISGAFGIFVSRRHWAKASLIVALTSVLMIIPMSRKFDNERGIPFLIVQPLIPQEEREDPLKFEEHFGRLAQLTDNKDSQYQPRLVLWPEAAIPDYIEDGYPYRYYRSRTAGADPIFARERLGSLIGEGSVLLAGFVHLNIGEIDGRKRATSARNAVSALDHNGEIFANYSKSHLVPFGEYLPLRSILEPLGASRLVAGSIDFIAGPGPRTIDLNQFGKAATPICYEIVFSGNVVDRLDRPQFIFNPSNDGWFGAWGPPQHLAQARMRAIEEGLPVLRATTTGISAVIDANGLVVSSLESGSPGRISGVIPPAFSETLFGRFGSFLTLFWAVTLLVLSFVAVRFRSA